MAIDDDPEDQAAPEQADDELEEGREAEEGQEVEASSEPPQRGRRVDDSVHALREQARADRERADDLQRQLYNLQQAQAQYSQQDQHAEQQRIDNMSPDERVEYYLHQTRREQQAFMEQQRFQTGDATDRASFQALCDQVPEYKKLAQAVEHELASIRQIYRWNAPRQLVLATLIGLEAMKSRQGVEAQRAAGRERLQRQKTTPASGSGDVQRQGRPDPNSREARAARLDGVTF